MVTDRAIATGIVTAEKSPGEAPSAEKIQDWIAAYLADLLEVEADTIDTTISFDRYGLDSATAVGMTGDLEDWLGRKLDPMLLYDYPTVESFSYHIAENFRKADLSESSS
jgi:acyl carrier protein